MKLSELTEVFKYNDSMWLQHKKINKINKTYLWRKSQIYFLVCLTTKKIICFSHTHYFSLLLLEVFFFRHRSLWLYVFSYAAAFYVAGGTHTLSKFTSHACLNLQNTNYCLYSQRLTSLPSLGTFVHAGHTELKILWHIYFLLF